jgi:hypothetical protein
VKLGTVIPPLAVLILVAVPLIAKDAPAGSDSAGADSSKKTVTGPHPTIAIESMDHDFGKLKPGTPIEYRFTFTNQGDAELKIESVKASCGCTTTSYDTLVAPGKSGSVLLAIKKTDTYNGKIAKGATVLTNDPEHERFRLTLHADFDTTLAHTSG